MIITLTLPFEDEQVLVQVGQQVDFTTPILKKHSKKEVKVPLADLLKIPAKKIFQHLKKFVGEEIGKNDLIAEYKSMLSVKRYFSEYDGVIKEINHNEGYITIEVTSDKNSDVMLSFFKAEIEAINKNEFKLKVEKYSSHELREADDYFGGGVFYYSPENAYTLTEDQINGRIIVADLIPAYEQVKLETLGVKGFVTIHSLQENTGRPSAKFKNIQDLSHAATQRLPYCVIDKYHNTIYFYH